jgi:hypothetical protein
MPVTVKLSRKFYEKFGEDVANELVDLLNAADTPRRAEFRELMELSFARFDAKLEQRLAEQDARLEWRFAEFDTRWERRLAESDTRWERRLGEVKADLIKWTFIFVTGGTFTVLSVMIAVLRLT